MKIIVDASIVFSALLNTNGRIGDLLMNSGRKFNFIAPDFLREEINRHYPRLVKISRLSAAQIKEAEFQIYKQINFISEEQIKPTHWISAEKLVSDVDPKDVQYVAFAKNFRCKIWSGDKALMKGLESKGFNNFISTSDLYKLREAMP